MQEKIIIVDTEYQFDRLMSLLESQGYTWIGSARELPTTWKPFKGDMDRQYNIHIDSNKTITWSTGQWYGRKPQRYEAMPFEKYMEENKAALNLNVELIQAIKRCLG